MGRKDTVTKDYMKKNTIFADAFNYYVYGGQQRIMPGQLQELDTTEIIVPMSTCNYRQERRKWMCVRLGGYEAGGRRKNIIRSS